MRTRTTLLTSALLWLALSLSALAQSVVVSVDPPILRLAGPGAVYSLLVQGKSADGELVDLTHQASYSSRKPEIVAVSSAGVLRARRDGVAEVLVEMHGQKRLVQVTVSGSTRPQSYHFENDIIPLLSRYGCNASGCHGKAEGQNGFKLSVFGSDPEADYRALLRESRGRRVLLTAPEHSLLLTKAAGQTAHGGGARIPIGSEDFATLRGWLIAGAPVGDPQVPTVTVIRVEPSERQLRTKAAQQLRVMARWSDGREADVTRHARFQSNNEALATVSVEGLVSAGQLAGEAAVMASYQNCVAVFRVLVPRPEKVARWPAIPEHNFIDTHVVRQLKKLNLLPSAVCADATFLRRVYLDIIGTLPTAAEARRFLADQRPDRRERLVDELLQRPEFADYWALQWADILRVDRSVLGSKHAYGFYHWIRASLAANKPLDQFARELIAAEGPLDETGPAAFFKVSKKPGETASSLAQVFLGVRLACAECHHHPYDRWSQSDYQGMQAFFTQVGLRKGTRGDEVLASGEPVSKHPRTGAVIHAHALGAKMGTGSPAGDRRLALAAWLTAPDNPWFARNIANRLWAHFLGRGLVEPVDDVRDTNPPSNPELLDALARQVVTAKFDLKQMIRIITRSRTYQLSTHPNATNASDERNHSRAILRRLPAEVLLDMVSQVTGVSERFHGLPPGYRAIQLWDSKVDHYFLKLFGRPTRTTACECERIHEPSVAQVLHLLNALSLQNKLSHETGTIARLLREKKDNAACVEELYLLCCSRFPTTEERQAALQYLQRSPQPRRQAIEDLAWTLLNTVEFVFNH